MNQMIQFLTSPNMLWLVFIVLAVCVALTAVKVSDYVAALAEKTALGGAFLGGFVLSLVTSLPELITSITASSINNPILSYGNIFGANALTGTVIAILDILFLKKLLFGKISKENTKIIFINVILNILVFVSLLAKQPLVIDLGFVKFSGLFFAIMLFYIYFIYNMYRKGSQSEEDVSESSGLEHITLKQVLVRFFIAAVSLILLSIVLTRTADIMALPVSEGGYGLGSAVAGALLLSICTGLPEIVSAINLARKGAGNIAIGGIVGSHFFNLTIIFIGDLVYSKGSTFELLMNNVVEFVKFKGLIIIVLSISAFLFVSTMKKNVKNYIIYLLPSLVIVVLYLYGWFSGLIMG